MKISVCMITYGHSQFIKQAVLGVLNQKTKFEVELIIADDCSPDNTQQILKDIIKNYPDGQRIKYTRHSQNKGMMNNFIWALRECSGNYIALCEGDDYWTDEYKLQKQVDFLEANEDYAICFHEAFVLYPDGTERLFNNIEENGTFDFLDLTQKNFISTASCVFRVYNHIHSMPGWFYNLSAGDWGLHLLNASKGKIFYLKDAMSVYRNHDQGVWTSLTPEQMFNSGIKMVDQLNTAFDYKYNDYFEKGKAKRVVGYNLQTSNPVVHQETHLTKLKRKIKKYLS